MADRAAWNKMNIALLQHANEWQLQGIYHNACSGKPNQVYGKDWICLFGDLEARFPGWSLESKQLNAFPFIQANVNIKPLQDYCERYGVELLMPNTPITYPSQEDEANDIDALEDDLSCVICMEKYPICIILPCAHKCVCCGCARSLCVEKEHVFCPLCKTEATQIIKVYE